LLGGARKWKKERKKTSKKAGGGEKGGEQLFFFGFENKFPLAGEGKKVRFSGSRGKGKRRRERSIELNMQGVNKKGEGGQFLSGVCVGRWPKKRIRSTKKGGENKREKWAMEP